MPRSSDDDTAVSSVVGVLVILPTVVLASMAAMYGVTTWLNAVEDHANAEADRANAEADRAERAAWCARHPNQPYPGNHTCPDDPNEPRGYDCQQTIRDTLICTPDDQRRTATIPGAS